MSWFTEGAMPHGDDFFTGGVTPRDTADAPQNTADWYAVFREYSHRGHGPEVTRAMAAAYPEAALAAADEIEAAIEFFLGVFNNIDIEDLYVSPRCRKYKGTVELRYGYDEKYRSRSIAISGQCSSITSWMVCKGEVGYSPTPEDAVAAWKQAAIKKLKEEYTRVLTGIRHAREAIKGN